MDERKNDFLKLFDNLQNYYQSDKYMNSKSVRDSYETIKAIEAGKLLLEKNGGKMILFNASTEWIKSSYYTDKNNHDKSKELFSSRDYEDYLKVLGRSLNSNMISCDIFQIHCLKEHTVI